MLTAGDARRVPAVADRRVGWWLRFLAGFAVLYGTLAGLAEIDATGRCGLPILAAVLIVALAVERVPGGGSPAAALRVGFGRPDARSLLTALARHVLAGARGRPRDRPVAGPGRAAHRPLAEQGPR
jgi:hypothetical protein